MANLRRHIRRLRRANGMMQRKIGERSYSTPWGGKMLVPVTRTLRSWRLIRLNGWTVPAWDESKITGPDVKGWKSSTPSRVGQFLANPAP